MSGPIFVVLDRLADGEKIQINIDDNITSLQPVVAAQLPDGVVAGTRIQFDGNAIEVRGTVTAVALAITVAGGSLSGMPTIGVNGDDGATLAKNSGFVGAVRNAEGDYTVTLTAPGFPLGTALPLISSLDLAPSHMVSATPTAPTTIAVTTYDNAGAALDCDFMLVMVSGLTP